MKRDVTTNRRLGVSAVLLGSVLAACSETTPIEPADPGQRKVASTASALSEAQVASNLRAQFFGPSGLAGYDETLRIGPDSADFSYLLVADAMNHTVRRVEANTGLVTTVAGVPGSPGSSSSQLRNPTAVAIGGAPGQVFIADTGNHTVRRVYNEGDEDSDTGEPLIGIGTVAGIAGQRGYENNGTPLFDSPQGIAIAATIGTFDRNRNVFSYVDSIYVADTGNAVIRRIRVAQGGTVELIAGTPGVHGHADAALGTQAKFDHPTGLVLISGKLYVADTGNHVIRAIDVTSGDHAVTTFAGTPHAYGHQDGPALEAQFAQPLGLAAGGRGLLVADRAAYTIRDIDFGPTRTVATIAGTAWERGALDGNSATSRFRAPSGIGVAANRIYVSDTGNNTIRTVSASGSVSTFTGKRARGSSDGWPEEFSIGQPTTLACDAGRIFINGNGVNQVQLDPSGAPAGVARTVASSDWPYFVYGMESLFKPLAYGTERLDLLTGERTRFSDVMDSDNDQMEALVATGESLYVRFTRWPDGSGLRRFPFAGGEEDLVGGAEHRTNPATAFMQSDPVAWDGRYIYSQALAALRKADSTVRPVTYEDLPLALGEEKIIGLAVQGNYAYFTADGTNAPTNRHAVRRLNMTTGAVSIFAGAAGAADAPFEYPNGLCITGGYLYVADTGNGAIRRIDLGTGTVELLAIHRDG